MIKEKAVLTVLLANATAAHFFPRRSISALSQRSLLVFGSRLTTCWMTAIAPVMSKLRNVVFRRRLILPKLTLPPELC